MEVLNRVVLMTQMSSLRDLSMLSVENRLQVQALDWEVSSEAIVEARVMVA